MDDVIPRKVIDHTSNTNGDLLIDFLVDCGMCIVNGRVGHDDFTHVSHRGKSVVDYLCVPHEQLPSINDFHVALMSDIVDILKCHGVTKVPDHSVLMWKINGCAKKRRVQEPTSVSQASKYNTSNVPTSFLNDDLSFDQITTAIYKIERDIENLHDVNAAYDTFKELIFSEMDRKLPKRTCNSRQGKSNAGKSLYKPYWSVELGLKWDAVCACERKWLRNNGSTAEKRRLRTLYVNERRQFEKLNKRAKKHISWTNSNVYCICIPIAI
ncbi:MAG: hypothetical protein N0E48_10500, partial [Candidatus Thiodiazotropha endolucinida]|nr:hypothetical protein [Candidatus Thiodiazotropha taylori]MCW4343775.1 hypothetical protein [Candidatus Thiodiazotropha endolucinida]